jgi:hypothetical protein
MKSRSLLPIVFFIASCSNLSDPRFEMRDMTGKQWFKGNLHTHAREGESDSSVESIVKWYMEHGYDFLVITDHSTITTVPLESSVQKDTSFLLIPGEEVIGYGNELELEINAFDIHKAILPLHNSSLLSALQDCIDTVRRQNGVPMINHPYYNWRLDGKILLESQNCNQGDDEHPALEEVWDFLLTAGRRIYGVASDDAHIYQQSGADLSNPGRGWVVVRAKKLDVHEIMQNLDAGLFYSSTGVEIADLRIKPTRLEILIKEMGSTEYTTEFLGSGGKVLHRTKNNPAVYDLSTESNYVRAKITDMDGRCAWIQPVFVVK